MQWRKLKVKCRVKEDSKCWSHLVIIFPPFALKSFPPSLLNPTFDFNILWEVEGAYGKTQWRETAGSGVSIKTRFHFTGEKPETCCLPDINYKNSGSVGIQI